MKGPQRKPNARTLRRLVIERLAAADATAQLEDPQAVGAVFLTDKEWQAVTLKPTTRRGRPKLPATFTESLRYFVDTYTPWAKYALRCKSALRKVRGSDPNPNLWRLFALTYFSAEECQRLDRPAAVPPPVEGLPYEYCARAALPRLPTPARRSAARHSGRRRRAVAALLDRARPSEMETVTIARQLCAEMRRVKLPPRPTRSFVLKDGTPTSPVWFLTVFTRVESRLSPPGHLTPGEITNRIGKRLFFPVTEGRKKLPPPRQAP